MHPRGRSGRRWRVAGALTAGLAFSLASCGTLLYPERRGQPAGRLDVGVVALDGVGLLLFLVPGVVAFAVDFATGAIYLPPGCASLAPPSAQGLCQVRIDPRDLTPRRIEEAVRQQTGKAVSLRPGAYRATPLQGLDDFTPQAVAELGVGSKPDTVIFRASRE